MSKNPLDSAARLANRDRVLGFVGGVAVFLIAILYNQSAVHWRENIADSHLFSYYGWSVLHGARPYLDVWDNKPPGIWWANAAAFGVLGESAWTEPVLCSAALLVSMAALWGIARAAFQPVVSWVAALAGSLLLSNVFYECGANRTETFVVAAETLAFFGAAHWLRTGRVGALVLSGLAAGAAPLFKQIGLGAALACLLIAVVGRPPLASQAATQAASARKRTTPYRRPTVVLLCFVLAALTPMALAGAVLLAQDGLQEAIFATLTFNRLHFTRGDADWWQVAGLLRSKGALLGPLLPLIVIAVLGVIPLLVRLLKRSGPPRPRLVFAALWLWALATTFLVCGAGAQQSYHFMPLLPPLGLLGLAALDGVVGPRQGRVATSARPTAVAAGLVLLAVLFDSAGIGWRQARQAWNQKATWYALERRTPAAYEHQGQVVASLIARDETIYVWGWSPGTYRSALRPCPSRFATLEKVGQLGDAARFILDGAIADIQRAPPAAFVISIADYEGLLAPPRSSFAQWVADEYEERAEVEGMHILLRRDRR